MTLPASVKAGLAFRSGPKDEVRSFVGRIKRETDKAILFEVEVDGTDECGDPCKVKKDCWFPLSQTKSIHRTFSIVKNTLDSIVVTLWIAQQKELA